MEEYRRYNVIGYDDMCGLDSQGDYRTLSEARQKVRRLLSGPDAWEAAHIYDYKTGSVVESFNRDPHGDFAEWVDCSRTKIHWEYKPRNVPGPTYQVLTYHYTPKGA